MERVTKCQCDVIIIGGGPAGLSAAINAASEGLRVTLIEAAIIGGQARASKAIENFVGHIKVTGEKLMDIARQQAYKFGVSFVSPERIVSIVRNGEYLDLEGDEGAIYRCKVVILALGVNYQTLDAKNVGMLVGRGIEYRPTPEATKGHHVVVGGANSAGQAAVYLAEQGGCEVTLVARSPLAKSMSKYLIQRIEALGNIRVLEGAQVVEVHGRARLEEVVISHSGRQETLKVKAMHVFVGSKPKTKWLPQSVVLDPQGFIRTGIDVVKNGWPLERLPLSYETAMPGVFAAGDARSGSIKRIAASVGEGSAVVSSIHAFLELNGHAL